MLEEQEHLQELLRLQAPDKSCIYKDTASLVLQRTNALGILWVPDFSPFFLYVLPNPLLAGG